MAQIPIISSGAVPASWAEVAGILFLCIVGIFLAVAVTITIVFLVMRIVKFAFTGSAKFRLDG